MRILNIHTSDGWPRGSVNIMRTGNGIFGNPFRLGADGDRDTVVDLHMKYLRWCISNDADFAAKVKALKGHDLMCCCAPERCHGDNLKIVCEELNNG